MFGLNKSWLFHTGFYWLDKSVHRCLSHAILSEHRDIHQRKHHTDEDTPHTGRCDIDLVHSGVPASSDLLSRFQKLCEKSHELDRSTCCTSLLSFAVPRWHSDILACGYENVANFPHFQFVIFIPNLISHSDVKQERVVPSLPQLNRSHNSILQYDLLRGERRQQRNVP